MSKVTEFESQLENLKNTSKWYEEHPEVTEPNMEELADKIILYAKMNSIASKESISEKESFMIKEVNSHLSKMLLARKDGLKRYFNDSPTACNSFQELMAISSNGSYPIYEEDSLNVVQERLLRTAFDVDFYITSVQRQDKDYLFDNYQQYEKMIQDTKILEIDKSNPILKISNPLLSSISDNYSGEKTYFGQNSK